MISDAKRRRDTLLMGSPVVSGCPGVLQLLLPRPTDAQRRGGLRRPPVPQRPVRLRLPHLLRRRGGSEPDPAEEEAETQTDRFTQKRYPSSAAPELSTWKTHSHW